MACDIQILTASGTSLPQQTTANSITIGGTAQDCAQVNVTISCRGNSTSVVAGVGFNGSWAAVFDTSTMGCACKENMAVAAYCVGNSECFRERTFDLPCTSCSYVDNIVFIIDLENLPEPPCVTEATQAMVSLSAQGAPGSGQYVWDFDDGKPSEETTVNYVSHRFDFPGTYNVKVTYRPTKNSCPQTVAYGTLNVPDCKDVKTPPPPSPKGGGKPPPGVGGPGDRIGETDVKPRGPANGGGDGRDGGGAGGGRLSCDALLVAAIMLLIAGGATIAIAICTKAGGYAILAGVVGLVLGAGLFALWVAICGKITSCDVMQKMHWLMGMILLFGVPLGVIGAGAQAAGLGINLDAPCWAAILGNLAAIGWLKDRLREIMENANCTPTALF